MVTLAVFLTQAERRMKPSTKRGWSTYMRVLVDAFGDVEMRDISAGMLGGLCDEVERNAIERAVSNGGRGAYEGMRNLCVWVWRKGVEYQVVDVNVASQVDKRERVAAREPRALTHEELRQVWSVLTTQTADPRLSALVYRLALETGLRRAEMLGLTLGAMQKASGTLEVVGKGGKKRRQPITRTLWDGLRECQRERLDKPKANDALLVNMRGQSISHRWFEERAKRVRLFVPGLGREGDTWFTWHLMRHTAGSLIERQAGFATAAGFLGHSVSGKQAVTLTYTKPSLDQIRSAVQAVWREDMAGLNANDA